jgi:hypothetical protein
MIVITRSVWLITKLILRIGSLKALLRQRRVRLSKGGSPRSDITTR